MTIEIFPAKHQEFYSKFEKWRKEKLNENVPESGVYKLIANKKIGRLLKDDKLGILYIGKGIILPYHNRIGKFVNSLNNTEKAHDAGVRFNAELIRKNFPLEETTIEITLSENAEQLESELLNDYERNFGELPPLNRRLESHSE
jgi:hypothetical protein